MGGVLGSAIIRMGRVTCSKDIFVKGREKGQGGCYIMMVLLMKERGKMILGVAMAF